MEYIHKRRQDSSHYPMRQRKGWGSCGSHRCRHGFFRFIDTHCHSRDGSKGAWQKGRLCSFLDGGSRGITTIHEMPNSNPAIYSVENLQDLIETTTPKAYVDFGVWGLCPRRSEQRPAEAPCRRRGSSLQIFLGLCHRCKDISAHIQL